MGWWHSFGVGGGANEFCGRGGVAKAIELKVQRLKNLQKLIANPWLGYIILWMLPDYYLAKKSIRMVFFSSCKMIDFVKVNVRLVTDGIRTYTIM